MTTTSTTPAIPAFDPAKLDAFMGRFVGDLGAAMHAATVVVGDRLGLYRALAQSPASPAELAKRTGVRERVLLEWLRAQAAAGYADYDATTGRYSLNPEQAFALVHDDGPALPGAFYIVASLFKDDEKIVEAFRRDGAFGWHEHHHDLFLGTERFFRPNYMANLVSSWIPALDGVEAKLRAGATVADVGCGHGASTILMAQAYPQSRFTGYDYHEASVRSARERAKAAGVGDRTTFEAASAKDFPGTGFDLVTMFDCLHDMGDPAGASAHVRKSLGRDGTWMVVEPFAEDDAQANFNPLGRLFYSASAVVCTPCSLAQEVGTALGAQAGEARLTEVIRKGGFTRVRRATQTPFNLVLEARP